MDYRSYAERLDYILDLIRRNRFRSLEAVAGRFGVSTRTVKRMIRHLRDRGIDIRYDRQLNKYFIPEKE